MPKYLLTLLLTLPLLLHPADLPTGFRDPRYLLQPSDRFQLTYTFTPEFDESITIQPDGFASIKQIGDLKLEGLTLDQARAAILEKLKTKLKDPEINLTLTDFVRPAFTVAGQVGSPGRYEMHGRVNAVEAIAMAGGFKDSAKHSQVILFRRVSQEMAQTHILNLKKMMNASNPSLEETIQIQPGDLLVVPKNNVSKISDYIHWVNVGTYIPF